MGSEDYGGFGMSEKKTKETKKCQWIGSMKKISDIKARCVVDYETDCWHWRGAKANGRFPKISLKTKEGPKHFTGAKVAMLLTGHEVPKGMVVYHYKCHSVDCLNPAHLKIGTNRDKWEHIKREGYLRGDPSRAAINKAIAMKSCKVAKHMDEIMNSDKTSVQLAIELGIHQSTIRAARAKRKGSTQIINSSVFTWVPA